MVRNSIYVTQLRAYYRYHRPDDLLIFDMADTITNLDGVLKQMALSASSHQITPERTQLVRQQLCLGHNAIREAEELVQQHEHRERRARRQPGRQRHMRQQLRLATLYAHVGELV